jgi:hypothetical protein
VESSSSDFSAATYPLRNSMRINKEKSSKVKLPLLCRPFTATFLCNLAMKPSKRISKKTGRTKKSRRFAAIKCSSLSPASRPSMSQKSVEKLGVEEVDNSLPPILSKDSG